MTETEYRAKIKEVEHLLDLEKEARINSEKTCNYLIKSAAETREEYIKYKKDMEGFLKQSRAVAKEAVDCYATLRDSWDKLKKENEKLKKEKTNG